ncbi:hypothetical protein PVK06_019024 [Gossypium arboreum]|uniref:Uncharacterized protein n=1 Tax=Gossypium arboreum TaxID=29729 RepID=A0ABR0PIR6_GOSAR|nr:hypothetical protein PVK06_019024 [Gossypium arboreum]
MTSSRVRQMELQQSIGARMIIMGNMNIHTNLLMIKYGYSNDTDGYYRGWSSSYSAYGLYPSYCYSNRDVENEEYFDNPSFAVQVGTLEDGISSCQDRKSSMSKTLDQLLEATQSRLAMNALVELSVDHDVPKLEEETHLIVIEHDKLKRDVQQEFGVEDQYL